MTENSALRNLAARNRVRRNFGLMLFVDMHFRADNFHGYATFLQTVFVACDPTIQSRLFAAP